MSGFDWLLNKRGFSYRESLQNWVPKAVYDWPLGWSRKNQRSCVLNDKSLQFSLTLMTRPGTWNFWDDSVPQRIWNNHVPQRIWNDRVPQKIQNDRVPQRIWNDCVPKKIWDDSFNFSGKLSNFENENTFKKRNHILKMNACFWKSEKWLILSLKWQCATENL